VARNKAGEIRLTNAAYPDNVPYTDVKNLEVVCGDNPEAMRGILKRITSAPI
jgi:hypothetical protein